MLNIDCFIVSWLDKGPLYSSLLARAEEERHWLSYSIGPSNWNGPTPTAGMLPKELQPFAYDMVKSE